MLNVESDGAILRLTIDRPEVRNAFNDELIKALGDAFTGLPAGVRAVVLTGSGETFCAGGDLQWMRRAAQYSEEENFRDAKRLADLFQAIVDCPAVVIARVMGACYGGGCGLVAAADVAVASEDASFAFSEVRLGLVPATISPFVIPKIGHGHARALFATGEAFDSERALRIGLIHERVARDGVDEAVDNKLKAILAAGPQAVARAKALAVNPPADLDAAARCLAQQRSTEEGREGVSAFLDKRRPSFARKLNDA